MRRMSADGQLFEFFNTLEVSGMTSHKLPFKIGAPVILLHNLDLLVGLCNGTRLIVRRFTMRVVEAEIITGKGAGNVAFIPPIKFIFEKKRFAIYICKEAISFIASLCQDY
jgi:hypothetical protein